MRAAAALGAHGPGLSSVALSTTEVSYKGTKGQSHKETKDSPISPESPWGWSWGLGTFLLRGQQGCEGCSSFLAGLIHPGGTPRSLGRSDLKLKACKASCCEHKPHALTPPCVPAPQPSSSSGSEERSPGLPPQQAREVRFLELQKVASSSSSINR